MTTENALTLNVYPEAVERSNLTPEDRRALERFTAPNFAVKDERGERCESLRTFFYATALTLLLSTPNSKSRAVALTELETAMMWGVKAFYGAPGERA